MPQKIERLPCTCEIGWVDQHGQPTYDNNVAIGRCMLPARNYRTYQGRTTYFPATKWYQICAKHAEQLSGEDMGEWIVEFYYGDGDRDYFQPAPALALAAAV